MELKITKEKVLEASKGCPEAKKTLETLFPEAFEDERYYDLTNAPFKLIGGIGLPNIEVRMDGNYKNKAFFLSSHSTNWEIIRDSENCIVLLPTKNKE